MASKAERKRRKNRAKASITLPGGEAVPQTQPKDSRRGRAEDARKTALQARCRQSTDLMPQRAVVAEARALEAALSIGDPKARKEAVECVAKRVDDVRMRAADEPRRGDGVGRLILTEPEHRRAELWNATQHARATQLAYDRAIGAPNRHATCLRILAPSEAMHADAASPAPDDRSVEERVRDATRAQMQVEGWIGHTDSRAVSAFRQAVINDPDGPVRDWPGVLACLQCIVEGLRGEPVRARVRK